MITLFAYVFIALFVSFLCSILEAVLLSLSPAYIVSLEQKGHPRAALLRQLNDNIDRPLAAILTLNTIAHTIGAAGAGAQAAKVFGDNWLGAFSAVLTLMILVISEIIPKTIGARWWHKLAPWMAICVQSLIKILLPLIWVTELITKQLSSKEKNNPFLRDEIRAMADLGQEAGVLHGDESDLMKNMLRFRDLKIIEIMTPRSVMYTLPENTNSETYLEMHSSSGFSRIPVYGDEPDDINGFVMKNDILMAHHRKGGDISLSELKRPLMAVLETESLPKLMSKLLEKRTHIAMVVTEYGDIRGIITLEDMIETLLGREIVDENDEFVDMQQKARQKWAHRLSEPAIQS